MEASPIKLISHKKTRLQDLNQEQLAHEQLANSTVDSTGKGTLTYLLKQVAATVIRPSVDVMDDLKEQRGICRPQRLSISARDKNAMASRQLCTG